MCSQLEKYLDENNVRSFVKEGVKYYSVFDAVSIVSGVINARDTIARLQQDRESPILKFDTFLFSGAGQRVTPVSSKEQLLALCALIPNGMKYFLADFEQYSPSNEYFIQLLSIQKEKRIIINNTKSNVTIAHRAYTNTSLYIRVRFPKEYVHDLVNPKCLSLDVVKFGIAYSLHDRHHGYKKDNGYMRYSYSFHSRHEAETVENMLKDEFSHIAVNNSYEYLDVVELAKLLKVPHYDNASYTSYLDVAEYLFRHVILTSAILWPGIYEPIGYVHEILTAVDESFPQNIEISFSRKSYSLENRIETSDVMVSPPRKIDTFEYKGLFQFR